MTPATAIQELIAGGMTEAEIGQKVGAHQSTINRIKNGQTPTWEVGAALVALASKKRRSSSGKKAA